MWLHKSGKKKSTAIASMYVAMQAKHARHGCVVFFSGVFGAIVPGAFGHLYYDPWR